jgi:hypothetical protein
MQHHEPFKIAVIALMLSGLLIGPPPAVLSQGRDQNKTESEAERKVPAFKGSGVVRPLSKGSLRPPPPPALTAGVMSKLIGKQPGSLYARLSPSQPFATNRGALVFANAGVVESGEGYAEWFETEWQDPPENYLTLWLKSSAGSKYLIDCLVSSQYVPFMVRGPNSAAYQKVQLNQTKGHLIFTLEATSAGWYGFQISASSKNWTFYSCEVTNL